MGYIKIISEGMDTDKIEEKERDNAVLDFFIMKNTAESAKDSFFVSSSFYSHVFSYGNFYLDFVYQTWDAIQKTPSLKGIKQTTMQYVLNSLQCFPKEIENAVFHQLDEPRTIAGFKQPQVLPEYIYNKKRWQIWRNNWFVNHQDKIDWSEATNDLFPLPKIIESILKRELTKHKLTHDTDFVTQFHDKVMKHKGRDLVAYAEEIGAEICKSNYYVYESDLSKNEQKVSRSLRKIFSIKNKEKKKQYISIDFAHGMFEFFDEHGQHKGEFRFDGSFNSESEDDHSLKTL